MNDEHGPFRVILCQACLVHFRDKDCSAIEVCYHKICYKNYVRFLNKPESKRAVETVYSVAYNVFCNEVIDAQICRNKEVFFMSKLVDIWLIFFVSTLPHMS